MNRESGRAPGGATRGRFESDLSGLPVVRLRCPPVGEFGGVDVSSFFEGIDEALKRQQAIVALLDARGLPPVGVEERIEFVGMVNARRAALRNHAAAFAAVVGSPFERGLVTAFAWFANPPLPVRLFSATDEAEVWLHQRLAAFERGGP